MELIGYLLIACVIAIICIVILNVFELDEDGFFPLAFFFTIILPFFIMIFITETHTEVKTKKREERIYSLRDNKGIEGDFILGSGSVNGTMYYSYYKKNGDLYKWGKTEREETFIKEKKSVTPRIVTIREGRFNDKGWRDWFTFDLDHIKKRIIYVPEGTIIKTMKLDAK